MDKALKTVSATGSSEFLIEIHACINSKPELTSRLVNLLIVTKKSILTKLSLY
jgi:hypothetical protein